MKDVLTCAFYHYNKDDKYKWKYRGKKVTHQAYYGQARTSIRSCCTSHYDSISSATIDFESFHPKRSEDSHG